MSYYHGLLRSWSDIITDCKKKWPHMIDTVISLHVSVGHTRQRRGFKYFVEGTTGVLGKIILLRRPVPEEK